MLADVFAIKFVLRSSMQGRRDRAILRIEARNLRLRSEVDD
jgi:hypothetical protein